MAGRPTEEKNRRSIKDNMKKKEAGLAGWPAKEKNKRKAKDKDKEKEGRAGRPAGQREKWKNNKRQKQRKYTKTKNMTQTYLIRSARSPYPRETPQSEFRRLAVYPGNIPAEPDKPRQDPDGTGKKTLQNLVREGPRSLQNRSGTLPEHTRANKTPKNRKSAVKQ